MNRPTILLIDAIISLVLGVILAVFPRPLIEALGMPPAEQTFYPRMLGTVTIGIAIALFIEWWKRPVRLAGLGVGGAIAIDLCAALFLGSWLIFGDPGLPIQGKTLLWLVVFLLVGVSGLGAFSQRKSSSA